MKKLVLSAVVATLAACHPDTRNLERNQESFERKLDQIQQDQRKIMDLLARGGGGLPAPAAAAQPRAPRVEPDRANTYAVPIDNDAFEGPADAKITVVKAYDYACPYCEKVRGTMDELLAKYPGELRVVSKQLVVHPRNAMAGALAFCAAAKQGKARDMDRLIWDKGFKARQMDMSDVTPVEAGGQAQKCWDTPDGCKNVVAYAQELQLDIKRFKQDMKACTQVVQQDMKDLQALAVASTPAFFINGRYISGAVPIQNFRAIVDEELQKANQRIAAGTPKAQYYQQWVVEKGVKSVERK